MGRLYLAVAVILAAVVGCQRNDEFVDVQSDAVKVFYATFEGDAASRTALDAQNDVIWSANDQISVFAGNNVNNSFILESGEETTNGKFVANTLSAVTESNTSASELSANVAYYPYDSNVTVSENAGLYTVNATFPAVQTYSASGTFGNGASPMVAVTSNALDAYLKFKNVGAIFRLQLKGEATITKIVFSADANLAGDCQITAGNTTTPTVNVTDGSQTITLECGEGVELNNSIATNFVVAMLPVEGVTGGITITIYDDNGKKMVYTHKENETITIKRSNAYTTPLVTYDGAQDIATVESVQAALDAATDGTTIELEPNVYYGTLVFRAIPGQNHTTLEDIADAWAYNYTRSIENVTIIGAAGATVDAIKFETGALPGDQNNRVAIKNLVIDGVTFTDVLTVSAAGYNAPIMITTSNATIDGLTVKNCKLVGNNNKLNLVYLYGADGAKNVTLAGNTVDGIARLCEIRGTENVTITNNVIKNTAEHAMLLTGSGYSGNVTITGNTADGIGDRFVRMAGAGDATVTITNNVITNYKGEDYDYIKVTDSTGTPTIENNSCAYTVSTADALKAALKANSNGAQITLAAGTYEGLSFADPANYKAKNVTVVGQDDVNIAGFSVNSWSTESNIEINGLTFENVTFTQGLILSTKVMNSVTVDGCDFIDDACIHQNHKTEKLTNLKVIDCNFTGDKNGTTTALMLENTETLTVTGCTFTNIDFNVLQTNILSGTVLFDSNNVNGTGDRVFRFVEVVSGTDVTISNNTITSDGDEGGELAKSSNPVEITLTNNTWNGKTDADVADKLINITAK